MSEPSVELHGSFLFCVVECPYSAVCHCLEHVALQSVERVRVVSNHDVDLSLKE